MSDTIEPVTPVALSFVHPLLRISKSFRSLLNLKLEAIGLVKGQDELLLALTDGPKSISVLAETLNIRPSSVSKTADVLTLKGLLQRLPVEHDRRMTAVALTKAGHEAIAQIRAVHAALNRELTVNRTSDGRTCDPSNLGQLSELIDARLARLR